MTDVRLLSFPRPPLGSVGSGGASLRLDAFKAAAAREGVEPGYLLARSEHLLASLESEITSFPAVVGGLVSPGSFTAAPRRGDASGPAARPCVALTVETTLRGSLAFSWVPVPVPCAPRFKVFRRVRRRGGWSDNHIAHIENVRPILPPWGGYPAGREPDAALMAASHILLVISALFFDIAAAFGEVCDVTVLAMPDCKVSRTGLVTDWEILPLRVPEELEPPFS